MDLGTITSALTSGSPIGLLGGFIGRMIPQAFKFFDDKNDRAHELEMTKLQLQIDQARATQQIDLAHVQASIADNSASIGAWADAIKSQGQLTGNKLIDGISASVRPFLTYWWMALFTGYKAREIMSSGAIWTPDDWTIFSAILAFWFADRTLAKLK